MRPTALQLPAIILTGKLYIWNVKLIVNNIELVYHKLIRPFSFSSANSCCLIQSKFSAESRRGKNEWIANEWTTLILSTVWWLPYKLWTDMKMDIIQKKMHNFVEFCIALRFYIYIVSYFDKDYQTTKQPPYTKACWLTGSITIPHTYLTRPRRVHLFQKYKCWETERVKKISTKTKIYWDFFA